MHIMMEKLVWLFMVTLVFFNLMGTPVKADTGDTLAWVVGLAIAFTFTCAGIGAYARRTEGIK